MIPPFRECVVAHIPYFAPGLGCLFCLRPSTLIDCMVRYRLHCLFFLNASRPIMNELFLFPWTDGYSIYFLMHVVNWELYTLTGVSLLFYQPPLITTLPTGGCDMGRNVYIIEQKKERNKARGRIGMAGSVCLICLWTEFVELTYIHRNTMACQLYWLDRLFCFYEFPLLFPWVNRIVLLSNQNYVQ